MWQPPARGGIRGEWAVAVTVRQKTLAPANSRLAEVTQADSYTSDYIQALTTHTHRIKRTAFPNVLKRISLILH